MPSSKKYRVLFNLLYYGFWIVLFLLALEVIFRVKGYEPYRPASYSVKANGLGPYLVSDPELGYRLGQGRFQIESIDYLFPFSFIATHSEDGLRNAAEPGSETPDKPAIWLFGCSQTYGWRLNDYETYAWLLNKKLPEYKVLNFGVPGYGTLQALISLRRALKTREKPAFVIVSYGPYHDIRNTMNRWWKKTTRLEEQITGQQFMLPYARFKHGKLADFGMESSKYYEPPLIRHSALVHYLEQSYNKCEYFYYKSHEVSKELLLTFAGECGRLGIPVTVIGLSVKDLKETQTLDVLMDLEQRGVSVIYPPVDPNQKGNIFPLDQHFTAKANREIAEAVYKFILADR